jgi:hypothetical protein
MRKSNVFKIEDLAHGDTEKKIKKEVAQLWGNLLK